MNRSARSLDGVEASTTTDTTSAGSGRASTSCGSQARARPRVALPLSSVPRMCTPTMVTPSLDGTPRRDIGIDTVKSARSPGERAPSVSTVTNVGTYRAPVAPAAASNSSRVVRRRWSRQK